MARSVFRGLLIAAFFAIVAFVLVPLYVPRPAFIPGFAPPPDMWPRAVSFAGIGLGLLAVLLAIVRRKPEPPLDVEGDGASPGRMALRLAAVVAVFAGFLVLVPWIGFPAAAMLATALTILLTGERHYRLQIVLISVAGPVLLTLFFHAALGIQFPRGALTRAFGF